MPHNSEPLTKYFDDHYEHFKLSPNKTNTEKKEKPKGGWGSGSGLRKGTLSKKVEEIVDKTKKSPIMLDDKVYFILNFTGNITSNSISKVIKELNCEIINYYPNNTLKVAIKRNKYNSFNESLEIYRNYIYSIQESFKNETIDEKFLNESKQEPDKLQKVSIQAVNLSGFGNYKDIDGKLRAYVESVGGSLNLEYNSDKMILFEGNLKYETIKTILYNVGIIERIDKISKLSLDSPDKVNISNSKDISYNTTNFPLICIIDSGVNIQHTRLSEYIEATYDHIGNKVESKDTIGHGSAVAGIAIYGGDIITKQIPKSK